MDKIKSCPFCGSEAIYYEKPIPKVQCKACLAEIRGAKFKIIPFNYEDYLIGLWNRRVNNA